MSRRSTLPSMFSMTSILSDTFAPPRIATNGRSGDSSACPRYCSSCSISRPAAARWQVVRDALDRRVRAVRRAERVVHVAIGQRRERLRERRVVLLLFGVEAQVLEQRHARAPGRATCCDRASRRRRRRSRRRTPPACRAARRGGRRPAAGSTAGSAFPSAGRGGSRGRRSRRARARTGSSAATRGSACRRRSAPSFSGTLKSTRMKTRLPSRSRS